MCVGGVGGVEEKKKKSRKNKLLSERLLSVIEELEAVAKFSELREKIKDSICNPGCNMKLSLALPCALGPQLLGECINA